MNRVIEIQEVGPDDGRTMAVPTETESFFAYQTVKTMDGDKQYRIEYADSGRKNASGYPIYKPTGFREEV